MKTSYEGVNRVERFLVPSIWEVKNDKCLTIINLSADSSIITKEIKEQATMKLT